MLVRQKRKQGGREAVCLEGEGVVGGGRGGREAVSLEGERVVGGGAEGCLSGGLVIACPHV